MTKALELTLTPAAHSALAKKSLKLIGGVLATPLELAPKVAKEAKESRLPVAVVATTRMVEILYLRGYPHRRMGPPRVQ